MANDTISVEILGVDTTAARFDRISTETREELRSTLTDLGSSFVDYVRANKLSGSPLRRVTGALQASLHSSTVDSGNAITTTVGTDSPYARYHEYGFHGSQNVRAHTRLGHPVRAFTRFVNYAGRPWFFPALAEYAPTIRAEIEKAVANAVSK